MIWLPHKITQEVVDRSYELVALLEVRKGPVEEISGRQPPHGPLVQLAGAPARSIKQAIQKWSDVHNALEGAQHEDGQEAEQ